jgi:hypothetical protein
MSEQQLCVDHHPPPPVCGALLVGQDLFGSDLSLIDLNILLLLNCVLLAGLCGSPLLSSDHLRTALFH